MHVDLDGQTALVTASTRGIGRATAEALAEAGADVILNGRYDETVTSAVESVSDVNPDVDVTGLVADVSSEEGCLRAIEDHPEVDLLVNNFGRFGEGDVFELTDEEWMEMFEANVLSGVRLTRYYLETMLDRGYGRVVFVASEVAAVAQPELPHYGASKAAVMATARSLAEMTGGTDVTVNTVLPGTTRTDGVTSYLETAYDHLDREEAEREFLAENRPTAIIDRLIDPREVADLIAFVCSPRAAAINGAPLRVDGGSVASTF